jgi:superfamily II DNA or RNA helicase
LKKVFPDDIVHKVDLKELIRVGILSEPRFKEVPTGMDFSKEFTEQDIQKIKNFDIDSIGQDTANTIGQSRERNRTIVDHYLEHQDVYKHTLVFALNQANAIALNKMFNEAGIASEYVISGVGDAVTGVMTNFTRENTEKIQRFRDERIQVMINVNILTEGTDIPNVQSVFLARPTISTILMTQMIGRGLRGVKAGGTKEAYIVSFIDSWNDQLAWVSP